MLTNLATVFTSDVARALRVAHAIEAGTVGVNSVFMTSLQTPFGGWKQSGHGRECGEEGLKQYLQTKTIHINLNVPKKS
jgi:aldehyde dehydrogenase (NAD+)